MTRTPRLKTPKPKRPLRWWARGGGIRVAGPFASRREAVDAHRLVDDHPDWPYPRDLFVWESDRDEHAEADKASKARQASEHRSEWRRLVSRTFEGASGRRSR